MKAIMQNAGRVQNQDEYNDWKAGQEAIKDLSGFVFSFYNLSNGTITAFYKCDSIYGLKRGQKVVEL